MKDYKVMSVEVSFRLALNCGEVLHCDCGEIMDHNGLTPWVIFRDTVSFTLCPACFNSYKGDV